MLGLIALASATAELQFDPQARVTEAIGQVRRVSYNADKIDWAEIEREMRAIASKAKDTVDLLPAYGVVVLRLGDNHSFVRPTAAQIKGYAERYGKRRLVPDLPPRKKPKSAFTQRKAPLAEWKRLGTREVLSLTVPSVEWLEGSESAPYGNQLWALATSGAKRACGYIVDLRGNTGGDVFPMVTGLSSLIGEGYRPASKDRTGKISRDSWLTKGAMLTVDENGKTVTLNRITGWRPLPTLATAPVAVLTDDATASSGEHTALAFRGRAHSRSFGERTAGAVSGNEMIELKDGVRLFVTTQVALDRGGAAHPEGIAPDEAVVPGPGDTTDPDDAVLERAKAWLSQQRRCR